MAFTFRRFVNGEEGRPLSLAVTRDTVKAMAQEYVEGAMHDGKSRRVEVLDSAGDLVCTAEMEA